MAIDAFVIRDTKPRGFAERFLASPEFTTEQLREIKNRLQLRGASGSKAELAQTIISAEGSITLEAIAQRAIAHLPSRRREWMTIKTGRVPQPPTLRNPAELVLTPGDNEWYGPLIRFDDSPNARWYVHPLLIPHWEADSQGAPQRVYIRWLCWARVATDHISLHWNNFTYGETEAHTERTVQYAFWQTVPSLFDTFTALLGANVEYLNLQNITLHRLWDQYLGREGYQWRHRRIRAESGGVSLSAYAGRAVVEMGTGGIEHLATTIRRSIQDELDNVYQLPLSDPERIDDIILRTLIREYGTVSYEFNLAATQPIIEAHVYFGTKPNPLLQDNFPHVRFTNRQISDLDQLRFLLDHKE